MPDSIVCTRAVEGGSFSSEPGPTRLLKIPDSSNSLDRHGVRLTNYHNPYDSVLKLSNAKRVGVAPRAGRVGLQENTPAKALGIDCGTRFLKTHLTTNPVVDPISHGWCFDDPAFLKDLTFTFAGDMDRNIIPTGVASPTLSLAEK
jgi:hypothetical protein